ncbi:Transcriptional regulator containing PAS, AAA-type ATPase, and DNA-binding Fis domains [Pseudomonas sp. 8Z]|uniref:sigma-54-dependent Fis family transcriptional regulator n=1 Tax=Pseudomonas sp. 8Z TaxID=2653166 RepID=UPI0012F2251A|nr:sigma 54-interacting transcriptional regulator [Pseudomonas sp. 8Z]VXC31107.1 Transcriptional regulator containing PAS, AAA-type ATPase, and DNA-binding Fis domains [Pseudomonas sp. 8Z]
MLELGAANDLSQELLFVSELQQPASAVAIERGLDAAWVDCLAGDSELSALRSVIRASWLRSRAAGVEAEEFHYEFVEPQELTSRLAANREVLDIAAPIMAELLRYNPGGHLNLADADGVTLSACGVDLTPLGSRLLEQVQGTNCTGLALREQRLVFVLAGENFKRELRERHMHCASAPVRDPQGRLLGALTLTAAVGNFHCHTLGTVQAAAEAVSRQLALKALLDEQQRVLEVLNEGVILLDDGRHIRSLNGYARRLLQLDDQQLGRPFASLIAQDTDLGHWLDRRWERQDRELTLLLPDGGSLPCLASASPIAQGGWVLSLRENRRIREITRQLLGTRARYSFADIQGRSAALQDCIRLAQAASRSEATVLIQGESGVGKELFAQAIHNASSRCAGPFVAVNCGAIPRDLVQSELFGHVEGAFTGAARGGAAGKFELADGGTLFLDEIGDMPLDAQISLLRVLQEGEVTRIGAKKAHAVDVRVIAATHRDLAQAVVGGSFREDVFYRLNVLTLEVPPLRERREDIPKLVATMLKSLGRNLERPPQAIADEALALLMAHNWPGNVRELENVIERAINLAQGAFIQPADLPPALVRVANGDAEAESHLPPLELGERDLIRAALEETAGNIRRSASLLGISRAGIYLKLKRYGLDAGKFRRLDDDSTAPGD